MWCTRWRTSLWTMLWQASPGNQFLRMPSTNRLYLELVLMVRLSAGLQIWETRLNISALTKKIVFTPLTVLITIDTFAWLVLSPTSRSTMIQEWPKFSRSAIGCWNLPTPIKFSPASSIRTTRTCFTLAAGIAWFASGTSEQTTQVKWWLDRSKAKSQSAATLLISVTTTSMWWRVVAHLVRVSSFGTSATSRNQSFNIIGAQLRTERLSIRSSIALNSCTIRT